MDPTFDGGRRHARLVEQELGYTVWHQEHRQRHVLYDCGKRRRLCRPAADVLRESQLALLSALSGGSDRWSFPAAGGPPLPAFIGDESKAIPYDVRPVRIALTGNRNLL